MRISANKNPDNGFKKFNLNIFALFLIGFILYNIDKNVGFVIWDIKTVASITEFIIEIDIDKEMFPRLY